MPHHYRRFSRSRSVGSGFGFGVGLLLGVVVLPVCLLIGCCGVFGFFEAGQSQRRQLEEIRREQRTKEVQEHVQQIIEEERLRQQLQKQQGQRP